MSTTQATLESFDIDDATDHEDPIGDDERRCPLCGAVVSSYQWPHHVADECDSDAHGVDW